MAVNMDYTGLKKIQFLNSFQLKLIAIISMVIDHIGAILYPHNLGFRYIGRIAFPIFCFLLVEGFYHTKDIKKYIGRMLIFALSSEIPYDLAFNGVLFETDKQNVFITLVLGLLMLYALSHTDVIVEKIAVILLAFSASILLSCDYGYRGLLLILAYYLFRENRMIAVISGAAWNLLWNKVLFVQIYGVLAGIPILLYNGKRGRKIKYVFYAFYPVHLICLFLIRRYYF